MPSPESDRLDWTRFQAPPYLLGTTLVLWGILSGHVVFGVVTAMLLESHRWTKWRWPFTDQDYIRVWNLCVALFLIVAVFQVVGQELGRWQITRAFQTWMPILLFPMMWTEAFSSGRPVPLITFSLVARRKRIFDERAGRRLQEPRRARLGYFYFGVLLLSLGAVAQKSANVGEWFGHQQRSGWGGVNSVYLAATALLGWALLAFIPKRRWLMAALALLLGCYLGHYVHGGLRLLHGIVETKTMEWLTGRGRSDGKSSRTSFGEVGELKLSPKVFWRVRVVEGEVPRLLPEAIYHHYRDRQWFNENRFASFSEVTEAENQKQWEIDQLSTVDSKRVLELRGRIKDRTVLLPRMDNTALVYDLDASLLQKNIFGTLRAHPTYSSLFYTLYDGPVAQGKLERNPHAQMDYHISKREVGDIQRVARSLELAEEATPRERIQAVEQFFSDPANGFRYTKWLRGYGLSDLGKKRTHLGRFLSPEGRAGHCEYYATTTVLLLRALGVPARYVVGYALEERDEERGEYLLRGTHRHAWVRAWDEEVKAWVNVDTTPSDWLAVERASLSPVEAFLEKWDRWMLSWNLWRRADDKGLLWTILPLLLAGGLLIVVVLRLVRGLRKRRTPGMERDPHTEVTRHGMDSAWFTLENDLAHHGNARQPSQSVHAWTEALMARHPHWRDRLVPLVDWHYRYRFDPEGVSVAEQREFREAVDAFKRALELESGLQVPK